MFVADRSQQLGWYGQPRVDGVFALWYGKGVGVDRACEALKLANFEGTARAGGALVLAGDDHAAKSSLTAHQSEHTLIAGFIPVLYPATTDDLLAMGQFGWAMSRASGLYVGVKAVTDTLDLTSTVTLPGVAFPIVMPDVPGGLDLNLQQGMSALRQEQMVVDHRLPMAQMFARANRLDRVTIDAPSRQLTIVAAGKAWLDVCQALADLGMGPEQGRAVGLRVVKLALIWPLDPVFARDACAGSREVLVLEEKRPVKGVSPVVLVSDNPARFKPADLPQGVRVLHRDHLDEVQRELRAGPGTSAIVYEQTCANEQRRRRKRGTAVDPDLRLAINEYRSMISQLVDRISPDQLALATAIAAAPEEISGYGPVKQAGVDRYRDKVTELLARLPAAAPSRKLAATTA